MAQLPVVRKAAIVVMIVGIAAAGVVLLLGPSEPDPESSGCVSRTTGQPLLCDDLYAVPREEFDGKVRPDTSPDEDEELSGSELAALIIAAGGIGVALLLWLVPVMPTLRRPTLRIPRSASAGGGDSNDSIEVNKAGVGLAVGGASLMIVATFLPRVESTRFLRVVDNTLVASGDGFFVIGLAVAIIAGTYRLYQQGKQSWSILIAGLIGIALAVYSGTGERLELEGSRSSGNLFDTTRVTESASPGVGIYATGVGALIVCSGGLLLAGRGIWGAGAPPPARRTKKCPDCAETVLADARVCKHCGFRFPDEPPWRTE